MIEVRLSQRKIVQLDHEVHIAHFVLKSLRDKGVPVIGKLLLLGVEHGTLTVMNGDLSSDDLIYQWEDD